MALDCHARDAQTLDTIGVDCALSQPLGIANLLGFGIEHLYEIAADKLTFLFRVGHSFKVFEELLTCINANYVQSQALISLHYLGELVLSEHAMVHENAGEVLPDGLI